AAAVACDRGPESAASHRRSRPPHGRADAEDRKSTRLNSSHVSISYAVFCLKKKNLTKVPVPFGFHPVMVRGETDFLFEETAVQAIIVPHFAGTYLATLTPLDSTPLTCLDAS